MIHFLNTTSIDDHNQPLAAAAAAAVAVATSGLLGESSSSSSSSTSSSSSSSCSSSSSSSLGVIFLFTNFQKNVVSSSLHAHKIEKNIYILVINGHYMLKQAKCICII